MNRAQMIIQGIMAGDFSTAMTEAKSEIKARVANICEDHQAVLLSSYGMTIIEKKCNEEEDDDDSDDELDDKSGDSDEESDDQSGSDDNKNSEKEPDEE